MCINQFRSLLAVGVLWLAVGAGCHKEQPEPDPYPLACNNGSCCNPNTDWTANHRFYYVADIASAEANLLGDNGQGMSVYFKELQPKKLNTTETVTNQSVYQHDMPICILDYEKTTGLEVLPFTVDPTNNDRFRYRVSGKVYWDAEGITITARPSYYLHLERIESNP